MKQKIFGNQTEYFVILKIAGFRRKKTVKTLSSCKIFLVCKLHKKYDLFEKQEIHEDSVVDTGKF